MMKTVFTQKTAERKFRHQFERKYFVTCDVTVLDGHEVVLQDGKPFVVVKDVDPTSLTYGMNVMYDLQQAADMGYAIYKEAGDASR
jgi:hypothetical protein